MAINYPNKTRAVPRATRAKMVFPPTAFVMLSSKTFEAAQADKDRFEEYVSALLILQDMMLSLYDSGEHSRFTPLQQDEHLNAILAELAVHKSLMANVKTNFTRAKTIVELHRQDRELGEVAAQRFAKAILDFYRDLSQRSKTKTRRSSEA
jgi:hypothetical protein